MSRKERESRTPAQVVEQPNPGADDSPPQRFGMPTPNEVLAEKATTAAAPERQSTSTPTLDADTLNRARALLWRACLELGASHPARQHLEDLVDIWGFTGPNKQAVQNIIAILRLMHAPESVLRPLDEAADILAGRR